MREADLTFFDNKDIKKPPLRKAISHRWYDYRYSYPFAGFIRQQQQMMDIGTMQEKGKAPRMFHLFASIFFIIPFF